jgi:hypothetical protein
MWRGLYGARYSPGYQGDSDVDTRRTEIHDLRHLKLVEKATLRFEFPSGRVSLPYPVPLWFYTKVTAPRIESSITHPLICEMTSTEVLENSLTYSEADL